MTAISYIVSSMFSVAFGLFPLIALTWFMLADTPDFELNRRGLMLFMRALMTAAPRFLMGLLIRCVLMWLVLSMVALFAASHGYSINLWVGIVLGLWLMEHIALLFTWSVDSGFPIYGIVTFGAMFCALAAPQKLTPYLGACFGMTLPVLLCEAAFYWTRKLVIVWRIRRMA